MIVLLIPIAALAILVGAAVRDAWQSHRARMRQADRRGR